MTTEPDVVRSANGSSEGWGWMEKRPRATDGEARFRARRLYDGDTARAVMTLQTRYGLPANGEWGALERMMFEEVAIHTDAPRLEALVPVGSRRVAARVGVSSGRGAGVVAPARGAAEGAISAFGSAATGAALGMSAAIAIGAADAVRRGGSVGDFFSDAAENARGLSRALSPANLFAGRGARRRAALAYDGGARDVYVDDVDDYDGRGRGGGGYDPRGGAPPNGLPPGASEAYYGLDAQYHTARTRNLMAGATSADVVVENESRRRQPATPSRRSGGGGGARAQKALASMDLQRRQQALVNSPELEVEAAVGVGASSRPMVTMMQRVRDSWDAGLDAVGNVIPDGIPLIGNGSDFTARAQRERDLNARLAEARYYAELEQQKRLKAEQAFKQSHQKWLDAQAATREVRAQATQTAVKLGELEKRLFSDEIFDNHPVVSKVTALENMLMQETQEDEKTAEELKSDLRTLETNTMMRVKELEDQVAEMQLELETRPEAPRDISSRLVALENLLTSETSRDTQSSSSYNNSLQSSISDMGVALAELREGMRSELRRVENEVNGIHPLMDHGAGRIDILFAKLTALEHSVDAVSEGAASQIGRLSAQIDRLEKALAESSGVALKPFPQIEDVVVEPPAPIEEEEEIAIEKEEEEEIAEDSVNSSVDSAATDFFELFQESSAVVEEAPVAEPEVEMAPTEEEIVKESGVLPRIAVGREVMLQGFHWESHNFDWYKIVQDRLGEMNQAGFTQVWLPPPSDSLAPQGYLPRNMYSLNSSYGSEQSLRNLISNCREYDVLPVLDAVLNHRCATHQGAGGKWNRWEGTGMDWGEWAIDNRNPDFGGQGSHPTGDEFSGAPNIDHTNQRVREDLSKWFQWLRNDIGFGGVRFDFSKGYGGQFAGEYINAMSPEFAVGEYWDTLAYGAGLEYNQDAHRQRIVDWIDAAGGNCTAFDFTTKGILQEACGRGEFWRLVDGQGRAPGVLGLWPARAVTFIDNHDTGSTQSHWPFPHDKVAMGYAYILTHPGTPCVFWDHFFDWGEHLSSHIKTLMRTRESCGIHSRSKLEIIAATDGLYAAIIDKKVAVKLGGDLWSPPGDGWSHVCGEHDWSVWRR